MTQKGKRRGLESPFLAATVLAERPVNLKCLSYYRATRLPHVVNFNSIVL